MDQTVILCKISIKLTATQFSPKKNVKIYIVKIIEILQIFHYTSG